MPRGCPRPGPSYAGPWTERSRCGAHWLARSEHCPYQGFRVGPSAWGVQFHPEATAERIRHWNPGRLSRYGAPDPETLRALALREEPAATRTWRTVAHRFADVVTSAAHRGRHSRLSADRARPPAPPGTPGAS